MSFTISGSSMCMFSGSGANTSELPIEFIPSGESISVVSNLNLKPGAEVTVTPRKKVMFYQLDGKMYTYENREEFYTKYPHLKPKDL